MMEKRFERGSVIKGRDLKGEILCRILSEDMKMKGFQYRKGMNKDTKPLSVDGRYKRGLEFCLLQDIHEYFPYGTKIALVRIPDEEDVYVDEKRLLAGRIFIEEVLPLSEPDTWKHLTERGFDVTAGSSTAVCYAAANGWLDVVRYLHGQGADVKACGDYAVGFAAANGWLEIVRYLHENGADIMANDRCAFRWAAGNGQKEVVRYLEGS